MLFNIIIKWCRFHTHTHTHILYNTDRWNIPVNLQSLDEQLSTELYTKVVNRQKSQNNSQGNKTQIYQTMLFWIIEFHLTPINFFFYFSCDSDIS